MAADEGADLSRLLAGTQLTDSVLGLDKYKISVFQLNTLLQNIAAHCRPDIALDYGTRLNLSAFGVVGFAALSSPTARDAIQIAHRYSSLVLPLL